MRILLEGRLIQILYTHNRLERKDFSQSRWKQISATLDKLERLYSEPEKSTNMEDLLMIRCCAMFGVPVSKFHTPKRDRKVLDARAIFCKVLSEKDYEPPAIAILIRKDRTNVYNCLKVADALLYNVARKKEYLKILETTKL